MAGCLLRCSVYEMEEGREDGRGESERREVRRREKPSKEGTKTPVN